MTNFPDPLCKIDQLNDHLKLVLVTSKTLSSQCCRATQSCGSFLRDNDLSALSDVDVIRISEIFRNLSVCGYSSQHGNSSESISVSDMSVSDSDVFGHVSNVKNKIWRIRAESLRCLTHLYRKRPDSMYGYWTDIIADAPDKPGLLSLAASDPCLFTRRFAIQATVALFRAKKFREIEHDLPVQSKSLKGAFVVESEIVAGSARSAAATITSMLCSGSAEDVSSALAALPEFCSAIPWKKFPDRANIAGELLNALHPVFDGCYSPLSFLFAHAKPTELYGNFFSSRQPSPPLFEALEAALACGWLTSPEDLENAHSLIMQGLEPGAASMAAVRCAGRCNFGASDILSSLMLLKDLQGPLLAEVLDSAACAQRYAAIHPTLRTLAHEHSSHPSPRVRAAAARALVELAFLGEEISRLKQILAFDPCPEVVSGALRALIGNFSKNCHPGIFMELMDDFFALAAEGDSGSRRDRIRSDALRVIGFNLEISTQSMLEISTIVASALQSKSRGVVFSAIWVISQKPGNFKNLEIVNLLAHLLAEAKDEKMATEIDKCLKNLEIPVSDFQVDFSEIHRRFPKLRPPGL